MIDRLKENWDAIKDTLKENYDISKVSYDTWIVPMEIHNVDNDQVYILADTKGIPNILDYIKKKYKQILEIVIEEKIGLHCNVIFVTSEDLEKRPNLTAEASNIVTPELNSYYAAVMNANLNPRYTFDTFVVGSNNRFAHAASLAVAESPGTLYNPLFIYGGAGLGKTHLMQSIAHYILRNDPSVRVLYVTSETFTNDLIDSLKGKKNAEFKEKYRSIDVLMIDDIQFLIGKESTQEEFFHTFNYLYETGKQVIITSDKPPKDFTNLEERLRSRFSVGLPVDVSAPDYETRVAILHKKEETENTKISDDIINYIAENINTNIRELEGALNRITAFKRLSNKEITLNMAEDVLRDIINNHKEVMITVPLIVEVIASHFGFEADELLSQKRNKDIAYSRQIAMYLCRQMTDLSLQQIGKELGNRDHTTVRHGIEKITEDLKNSQFLQDTIDVLQKKINPALG
jgi:chromosomal replication initiator protein